MTNQHPITPPRKLLDKWNNLPLSTEEIFVIVAQWGADQELEACCQWVDWKWSGTKSRELRAARRPKPPSLKEQALAELAEWENVMDIAPDSPIRRALEALPE